MKRTECFMVALAISLLTGLVFWPALGFEWLRYWDDGAHIIYTEQYKGLSLTHLWWMLHPYLGQFMPLTWFSWAIDWKLFGLEPVAYHRTNVLLHALNSGLLFLVARRLIRAALPTVQSDLGLYGAGFAALLWALHPLRVESVAWVNERRDVLCGLFYLASILCYLKGVVPDQLRDMLRLPTAPRDPDAGGRIRLTNTRWLVASITCFALAVLSKALAVTLPVTLLLLDYYPLRRWAWREKIPYFVISTIGSVMAFVAIAQMDVLAPVQWITVEDRLLLTPYSLWWYLEKTVWPGVLSPLYELTFTPHFFQWRYFIPVVGVSLGTWLAVRGWRRGQPAWAVAWVAYAVAVWPISGMFQNGYQIVAARYSYLATLPILVLVGGLLTVGLERTRARARYLLLAPALGAVIALEVVTAGYLPVFHDGIAFWIQAVRVEPSCIACADFLVHQAKFRVAHDEIARVLDRYPDLQEQRFEIGMLAFMYARGPEGESHFREYLRQAAERDPGYIPRIEVGRQKHLALARQVLTGSPQSNLQSDYEGQGRVYMLGAPQNRAEPK